MKSVGKPPIGLKYRGYSCPKLEERCNFHISVQRSDPKWCFTIDIWDIGIGVVPGEQQSHNLLMSVQSSDHEWCSTIIVCTVGIDVAVCE